MKIISKMLSTVTILSALFGAVTANASVIDTVVSNPDSLVDPVTTVTFNHIFTDQGFVFGTTVYASGTLRVRLTDTTANEDGTVTLGTQSQSLINVKNNTRDEPSPNGTFVDIILNQSSLNDLNADGIISVAIRSISNTFYFADSVLTLETSALPAGDVPEPMSLALLGLGLFGIGAARRRK